ncbi:hypothetical protein EUGRSUZ_E00193 [Eucalyptus grandis]|uniref:Uncharacterized protein n=2 Tax=Eucalyptus grandis TaxID=71139 RepID=A0ACC3KRS1_EUCGR|nr:hypothetical protein EUGRSUZ_E00193 [Eucalyptus grandis]
MATGAPAKVSPDVPRERVEVMCRFFDNTGVSDPIPPPYAAPDGYSDLLHVSLKADQVRRGKVSCHLSVGPPLLVLASQSSPVPSSDRDSARIARRL